jgi:hypothetical protein
MRMINTYESESLQSSGPEHTFLHDAFFRLLNVAYAIKLASCRRDKDMDYIIEKYGIR